MNDRSIEQQLKSEGYYVTTTVGTSMRPMLRDRRDRVVIRSLETEERLRRYDLPLYRTADGRYLLHRVIGIGERGEYLVRGDNTYAIEHISAEQVLGVVTEFYRAGKRRSADDAGYRRYAAVWNALYPVRAGAHRVRGALARGIRRVFPKTKQGK